MCFRGRIEELQNTFDSFIRSDYLNFSGRTWRPPYEADTPIIQLTAGCTYNKCNFCSLYKDEPFCLNSLEQFEQDLDEIKSYQPNARRIFLTGANPFALSYEKIKPYIMTVRDYLIKCQSIAMFASIRDIKNKEVWQLKKLRAMGVNGLSIGTESGDDDTLLLANKGYTSQDIIEQCHKLDEAGIEYYFVYMTGLAGKDAGYRNAINSAEVFSQLNPYFISIDALTLFPDTNLYELYKEGKFVPAGEHERLEEMQTFIQNLQIRTHLFANSSSNFYPISANLPRERKYAIDEIQMVMDSFTEAEMLKYRDELKSLG